MATISASVTRIPPDRVPLPEWSGRFESNIRYFREQGILDHFRREFVLPRGSGYQPIDAFLEGAAYAVSHCRSGIETFLAPLGRRGRASLAAIGDRRTLPGQGSMSRVLAAIPPDKVARFCQVLLELGHREVLSAMGDTCLYHDACGRPIHVFHCDQRAYVFRQRALPEGEDLAAPERLPTTLVLPGYPGRKRGETQYSQTRLMHSGTGMWMFLDMIPGSGGVELGVAGACREIVRLRQENGVEREDTLLVIDGVDGGYTQNRACGGAGQPLLTRICNYDHLLSIVPLDLLRDWAAVEDSGSGPSRMAAELGVLALPGLGDMRTVVSRFPCPDGKKSGAGVVVDQWQYEFFITHMPVERLPANSTVTAYYGRSGQENRFCQEDRELVHKHLFSHHLPGQQFMQATALAVWNAQTVLGSRIASHPSDPYAAVFETRSEPATVPDPPEPVGEPASATSAETTPLPSSQPVSEATSQGPSQAASSVPDSTPLLPRDYLERRLKAGFRVSDSGDRLLCPQGHEISPGWLRLDTDGSVLVRFRVGNNLCQRCPRPCRQSANPRLRVEHNFIIPPRYVSQELALMCAKEPRKVEPPSTPATLLWHPPTPVQTPEMLLRFPTLVPTLLRSLAGSLLGLLVLTITTTLPPSPPARLGLTAETAPRRQHRRKTLQEQHEWNVLPEAADVHVTRGIPDDWLGRLPGECRRFITASRAACGADTG